VYLDEFTSYRFRIVRRVLLFSFSGCYSFPERRDAACRRRRTSWRSRDGYHPFCLQPTRLRRVLPELNWLASAAREFGERRSGARQIPSGCTGRRPASAVPLFFQLWGVVGCKGLRWVGDDYSLFQFLEEFHELNVFTPVGFRRVFLMQSRPSGRPVDRAPAVSREVHIRLRRAWLPP